MAYKSWRDGRLQPITLSADKSALVLGSVCSLPEQRMGSMMAVKKCTIIVFDKDSTILINGSNPCEGYIGIYHSSKLGYVGGRNWNENNDKVVCESISCGHRNESSTKPVPWPIDKVWISEVNCKGHESNLWNCDFPGWDISHPRIDSLQKIKCSDKININLDGFRCAGAVQYSTNGGETYSGYFCDTNWGTNEADLLCKTLNCGTSKEVVKQQWMGWKGFKEKRKMTINCLGITNVTHLWQCAQSEKHQCNNPASVICTDHERVQLKGLKGNPNVCSGQLQKKENGDWKPVQSNKTNPNDWCKQMHCGNSVNHSQDVSGSHLTCSANVSVVLMVNEKRTSCYGSVYVEVNGTPQPVCASTWTKEDSKVVCSELNCGSSIDSLSEPKTQNTQGIMDHVWCSGNEASLWHCRAKRDDNPFDCPSTAYVVCAASIGVRLIDGPGRCAGRVEIQHEDTWRRVYANKWKDINSDVICKQLDCGKNQKSDLEQFSQGSSEFLAYNVKCAKNAINISDCITTPIKQQDEKAMAKAITCEEHKVVFLSESCSGMVGIEQGNKIYWLSGSNTTWNQESANTVCQQMNCGNALLNTTIANADMMKSIWNESYSCSSNKESLFDCEKIKTPPSDYAHTIATVTCSGNITVVLDKGCWGNVRVCLNKTCGGVCADTWTDQKSELLCKNLGCGEVLKAITKPKKSQVIFKRVHSTNKTTNLNQCNFVRIDDNDKPCNHNPAYVVCSGSIKPRFSDSRDKCSGNVVVQYEDQWLPVCSGALQDSNTKNTICEELNCGEAVKEIDYFGPKAAGTHSISQIQCSAKKSLAACTVSPDKSSCKPGGLQCSEWRKMALATGKACSGAAMIHSEGKKSAIAFEGWTKPMGEKLCKHLECGTLKNNTKTTLESFWFTSFSCADVENPNKTIWDCEKEVSPSVESQPKQQLLIECQDEPNVTLSNASGDVMINGIQVCASNWKQNNSHMVCQQKNRSNAFAKTSHVKMPIKDEKYYHVSCEDNHYELGQCKRFRGKCEGNLVSVYCVGNARFRTTEKCGGQIEVNYRETWEKVCPLKSAEFTQTHLEMLCRQLDCGGYKDMKIKYNDEPVSLETSLSCDLNNRNIKHCLSHQSCKTDKPAEIYCNAHVAKPTNPPDPPTTPIWPAMLVVGFILVLVILIVVFVRICMVKKAKKGSNDLSGMLSRKEVEIESGSYDDVMSKSNEMEELNHGRLRSEPEVVTENDARSTSSFPYDDIDDPAVAQPLISPAATDGASGDDRVQNEVTYEVDDLQENYDDVEARPEITQTEAEVHDSTQTTPESDAAAPLGSVQGDDDYLVPRRVSQN
ncbi:scavenger receptor cysteine-rich type 1 protein M160 [Cebidichthys violaceus]|uniref:scavenger receptor cysteine-rich type 1 protein M160 n=1 Tax=Cebidichthys violaceus TaxID=271503 RepID=UPI0035CC3F45